jgi:hypothetical protein
MARAAAIAARRIPTYPVHRHRFEAGCIGVPPAVVGAVCDVLDVGHVDMPLTPETVWRAAHPAA